LKKDFELVEENMLKMIKNGPGIMRGEIYYAIKCMKKGKTAGIDDVPAEFLKTTEGETLNKL
jgi:hypothetical protein